MEATAQKMRAEGLKIEFRNCAEANGASAFASRSSLARSAGEPTRRRSMF
jgi:hypothetical protein